MDKPMDSSSIRDDAEFARLISLYLDDTLTEKDAGDLRLILLESDLRRAEFTDLALTRCGIVQVFRRDALHAGTLPPKDNPNRQSTSPGSLASWRSVLSAMLVAAAILILLLTIPGRKRLPSNDKSAAEASMASITSQYGAHWRTPLSVGNSLVAGHILNLQSGFVNIAFNAGPRVIVQGPARFSVKSASALLLLKGRLVARAVGGHFTIQTSGAVIRDLGTWFAVHAHRSGKTTVGVYEGRVRVSNRPATGIAPISRMLTSGEASYVRGNSIKPLRHTAWEQHFVKQVDNEPTTLSVVDILCGGDGTTRQVDNGINVATGTGGMLPQIGNYQSDFIYHRLAFLPVVDGCFVPGGNKPTQVDSAGDTFVFPVAQSNGYYLLWAGGKFPALKLRHIQPVSPILGNIDYSRRGHSIIYMHPNKGFTLNLRRIQRLHPGLQMSQFCAVVGDSFTTTVKHVPKSSTDVWVIVDGRLRYKKLDVTPQDGAILINVPLKPGDHFLTIADAALQRDISRDWIILGDPRLKLVPSSK